MQFPQLTSQGNGMKSLIHTLLKKSVIAPLIRNLLKKYHWLSRNCGLVSQVRLQIQNLLRTFAN